MASAARLYETAVRGERRPRILQSLSRLVESPAYAPRPQSGLGGWAQGRTFLAGGSQPLSLGLFSLEATQLKTVRTGIAALRSEPVRVEIQVLGSVTPRRNRRRPAESIAADTPQCTVTFVISGVAEARGWCCSAPILGGNATDDRSHDVSKSAERAWWDRSPGSSYCCPRRSTTN